MNELILSERMPVLAMRGLVLFPQATMHFDVGREKSVRALEAAMNADQHIFLVTQMIPASAISMRSARLPMSCRS